MGLIISIVVGVEVKNEKVISKTIIKAIRELTSGEISKLEKFITGQFSDGWGKNIGQTAICEWDGTIELDKKEEKNKNNIYKESYELNAHF